MQISSDILLDALVLCINDPEHLYKSLVEKVLDIYVKSDKTIETSHDDLHACYVKLLRQILTAELNQADADFVKMVLLKVKSDKAYAKHKEALNDLEDVLVMRKDLPEDEFKQVRKRLRDFLLWHHTSKKLKSTYSILAKIQSTHDAGIRDGIYGELKDHLNDVVAMFNDDTLSESANKTAMELVDFSNPETLRTAMVKSKKRAGAGIIKTGLIGLNRALGRNKGFAQGETITFNANTHNYKSGMLISCAIWGVIYNNEYTAPEGLIPLIYMVSLENEPYKNMETIFRKQYYQETGTHPDHLSTDEMIEWMQTYFARFNTRLIIERFQPDDFGFRELVARVNHLRRSGYDVRMVVLDYARKMNHSGSGNSKVSMALNHAICDTFSKIRNYFSALGIVLVTAHQLTRTSIQNSRNTTNVVKAMGAEFLADSIDVEREVDVSIYMHIEKNYDGKSFLTCKLNKHRDETTSDNLRYFAYAFTEGVNGIVDDYNKKPAFVSDIYAVEEDPNQPQITEHF